MASKRHVEDEEQKMSSNTKRFQSSPTQRLTTPSPSTEEESEDEQSSNVEGLRPPKLLKGRHREKRLIVVLEKASLEAVKVGKTFELLNSEDHQNQLKKFNREPASCRPDIVHQCLLMLMDSPLNRANLLQVYIHTERNSLIEINPQTRIPRTMKRFSGVMVQLLHKLSIRAAEGSLKLLKVIKNPISDHLPVGCKKVALSCHAKKTIHPRDMVPADGPVVVVIGAMAHGKVNVDYTEEDISISHYPLSAAVACSKMCTAFEEVWGVH